eukprot:5977640-Alexandrium_andersonii.AAC.1
MCIRDSTVTVTPGACGTPGAAGSEEALGTGGAGPASVSASAVARDPAGASTGSSRASSSGAGWSTKSRKEES